mmetsp:Transcript_74597/g.215566  ORF Transcript_74597/g.215566 Transcript_74597/m.215566 type:complete len:237 (+) Transcript_74597:922-1632(+)
MRVGLRVLWRHRHDSATFERDVREHKPQLRFLGADRLLLAVEQVLLLHAEQVRQGLRVLWLHRGAWRWWQLPEHEPELPVVVADRLLVAVKPVLLLHAEHMRQGLPILWLRRGAWRWWQLPKHEPELPIVVADRLLLAVKPVLFLHAEQVPPGVRLLPLSGSHRRVSCCRRSLRHLNTGTTCVHGKTDGYHLPPVPSTHGPLATAAIVSAAAAQPRHTNRAGCGWSLRFGCSFLAT